MSSLSRHKLFLQSLLNLSIQAFWLKTWDSYRKVDWINEIEYPELTYQETQRFLSEKFMSA